MREVLTMAFAALFSVFVILPVTRRYVERRTQERREFMRRASAAGCVVTARLRGRRRYTGVDPDSPAAPDHPFETGHYVFRTSAAGPERRSGIRVGRDLPSSATVYYDPENPERWRFESDLVRGASGAPCAFALAAAMLVGMRLLYALLGLFL